MTVTRSTPQPAPTVQQATGPGRSPHAGLALGLAILGIGVASVAVLGPLGTDMIRYHVSAGAATQVMGGDLAALALVSPTCMAAGMLVWRGHPAGPVMALGPAFYALYTSFQLAVGGDVTRYPGNSERFFALHLAVFVLAGAIAIRSWMVVDVQQLPPVSRRLDRVLGWFALVVAGFLALGLHLPGLVDAWRDNPTGPEYLADPVVFWLVKMMDLGLVVPALVAVGIGILVRHHGLDKAGYAATGWIALLGSAVAGMAIVMQATGDPAASTANTIAFVTFAAIGLGMAWIVYRPMTRGTPPRGDER